MALSHLVFSFLEAPLQADQEWASMADYMLWKVFQFPTHLSAGKETRSLEYSNCSASLPRRPTHSTSLSACTCCKRMMQ